MFFSVIVPVYNVEEYLPACIDSVLGQSFADFELILVDDGSPDACPRMCDEYAARDSRVRVIHKPNGGLAAARRTGIQEATGDYVFNLDSDDVIEPDTLACAYTAIQDTSCDIVSFAYRWVKDGETITITDDGVDEGFYDKEGIKEQIFPRLLMNEEMQHISYYLSGKAVKRSLVTPHQLNVSENISLGEDLCCVVPCYLNAESVYVSKKAAYLYSVRYNSMSKAFNAGQILLIENVIRFISTEELMKVPGIQEQLSRYSFFMCFAILASAAEGGYFNSIRALKKNIVGSMHHENIKKARFKSMSLKSRIGLFFMKRKMYRITFYFLALCKTVKTVLKKG